MDITAILQAIHRTYQGDVSYPVSGDDDYTLRFAFVEDSINAWSTRGSEENIEWKELFISLADAGDGDTSGSADTTEYAMPEDFDHLTSKVTITNGANAITYYDPISPDQVLTYQRDDIGGNWCYITGNDNDGYTLHVNAPIAGTLNYSYYKHAAIPVLATDKPEMKRPYFIIHDVLSKLFELDGRNDLVTFHEGKKKGIMDSMIIDNELTPFGETNRVSDIQALGGVSWGK